MLSFPDYVSVDLIHSFGIGMGIIILLIVLYEFIRWRAILSPIGRAIKLGPAKWWTIFFKTLADEIVYQQISVQCGRIKWILHSLVFWGFLALVASTTTNYINNPSGGWLPLTNIVRLLGNLGGVMILLGLAIVIYRARMDENKRTYTFAADYFFLTLLLLATLTGFLTEFASELNAVELIYGVYVIHLLASAALLLLAPFTRFIHAFGRPVIKLSERYLEALGHEGLLKPLEITTIPLLGAE
jgi:nitrate reductase gamma subunit